mgnify:CR=1 FL=1
MELKFLALKGEKSIMVKGCSVVRSFCLIGIAGMLAVSTGCAELKRLRQENQQLNENLTNLQQENATALFPYYFRAPYYLTLDKLLCALNRKQHSRRLPA